MDELAMKLDKICWLSRLKLSQTNFQMDGVMKQQILLIALFKGNHKIDSAFMEFNKSRIIHGFAQSIGTDYTQSKLNLHLFHL